MHCNAQNKPQRHENAFEDKNISPEKAREIRGASILARGQLPTMISEEEFLVPSQNSNKKYKVIHTQNWSCECPDYEMRQLQCKHICAIKVFLKLRNSQSDEVLELIEDINENKGICPECKSQNIVNNGKRKTKSGIRQRYQCKDCKKRFVLEPLKNHTLNAKMLCLACDLYFKGNSLRDINDTLLQSFGVKISHETIRQNILKFTERMSNYADTLSPSVSKKWGVDEQKVKLKGKWVWEWNIVDKKTRYLIANNVTEQRSIPEARQVFKKAKDNLNKDKRDESFRGLEISSDGMHSYKKAIRDEFPNRKDTEKYVIHKPTTHPRVNKSENMLVERYHNQYREFDKIRRDFKSMETLQQWGNSFRVYNNFIQKNNGAYLKGLTPAQASGINITNKNRWLSLLKLSLEK